MPKIASKNGRSLRVPTATKYDAHHTVLSKTYGALADLRRELAEPKNRIAAREEILKVFATCADSQRAWLLMEDYLEKLSLSRKDFTAPDWWPRLMSAQGPARLEEMANLFLRAGRPLPTELQPHANHARFVEKEQAEQEQHLLQKLEHWLFPPPPVHLDSPRALLRVLCEVRPAADHPSLHTLAVRFNLFRPLTGEKHRTVAELIELTTRATHEHELFSAEDWEFIQWLADTYSDRDADESVLTLTGQELLQWLAHWGHGKRLELGHEPLTFHGQLIQLTPNLINGSTELSFTHHLTLPDGKTQPLEKADLGGGRSSFLRELYSIV